jgi:hypothetical protein
MGDEKSDPGRQKQLVFNVRFMSDGELREHGGRGFFEKERVEMLAKIFDAAEIERLRALEDVVLAWIRRDPKHAVAYLTDPFGCIERQGLVDDPALLAKMKQLAEQVTPTFRQFTMPPGVGIRVE